MRSRHTSQVGERGACPPAVAVSYGEPISQLGGRTVTKHQVSACWRGVLCVPWDRSSGHPPEVSLVTRNAAISVLGQAGRFRVLARARLKPRRGPQSGGLHLEPVQ
jgi:hypothetical protein